MDRSSRGDHRDALCHHQKYNSRYLGVGWGVAKFLILFIYTKLGKNLFMVNGICLQDLIVFKKYEFWCVLLCNFLIVIGFLDYFMGLKFLTACE